MVIMDKNDLLNILEPYGLGDRHSYHSAAFARNIGLLDANELALLKDSTVAVPGLGGVGGAHLISLVRLGVGRFHLADMDVFNPVNVNRQYGAQVPDFGEQKLEVMSRNALNINPYLHLECFSEGVTEENIDAFLEGVDAVVDGLDFFVFDVRRKVFKRALEKGIPVITAGPMGFSSALLVFTPGGMGFDEYFDVHEDTPEIEKLLKFALGLSPRATHVRYIDMNSVSLVEKRGPSSGSACQLCAALASTEIMRLLLGRNGGSSAPFYVQYDPYRGKLKRGKLRKGNRGVLQQLKFHVFKNCILERRQRIGATAPSMPGLGSNYADIRDYILRAGVQAPSGDNVQPWIMGGEDTVINLSLDHQVDSSFFNVRQSASLLSCGAAIENMEIAARSCGMNPITNFLPSPDSQWAMAQMELVPTDKVYEHHLHDAIWLRATNRKKYSKKSVSDGVWESVASALSDIGNVGLRWINTVDELKIFSEAVRYADRLRVENRSLHEHLVKMIRYTQTDAEKTKDGLPLRNLEAGRAGELFLKATRDWSVMSVANKLGIGKAVTSHAAESVIRSGGIGYIHTSTFDQQTFLDAGRAFQRIWLIFSHLGIQFQPMAAPSLFRLRLLLEGRESFGNDFHASLLDNEVWPRIDKLFPGFVEDVPVMFFRVGFAPAVRFGTYRRPTSSFIV